MRLSHAAVAPTALVALVALVAVVLPAAPAHADDYDPRRPRPSDRFVVLRAGEHRLQGWLRVAASGTTLPPNDSLITSTLAVVVA